VASAAYIPVSGSEKSFIELLPLQYELTISTVLSLELPSQTMNSSSARPDKMAD
jgi:hypothetical protein